MTPGSGACKPPVIFSFPVGFTTGAFRNCPGLPWSIVLLPAKLKMPWPAWQAGRGRPIAIPLLPRAAGGSGHALINQVPQQRGLGGLPGGALALAPRPAPDRLNPIALKKTAGRVCCAHIAEATIRARSVLTGTSCKEAAENHGTF